MSAGMSGIRNLMWSEYSGTATRLCSTCSPPCWPTEIWVAWTTNAHSGVSNHSQVS